MQNNGNRDFNATNASFADGGYTVRYYCRDSSGNLNGTETRGFSLDTTAPLVNFTAPTPGNNTYQSSPNVSINTTVTELSRDRALLEFNAVNYTMSCTSGSTAACNYTVTGLSAGTYVYRVFVNDTFGNSNATETRTVTIDAGRPGITFGLGTEGAGEVSAADDVYINVSLSEPNLANITYSIYNGSTVVNRTVFTSATLTLNVTGLGDATYTYEVNATDVLNNKNGTSIRRIQLISSCLNLCTEGSACTIINKSCALSSDLCSGSVCDFTNLTLRNATIYSLYNGSGAGKALVLNISSNASSAVNFITLSTFVFNGKNGTTADAGSAGSNGGIVNITVPGLFNRTNSRFISIGGRTTSASGAGGNGGILQINYHGLIGTSYTTVFTGGTAVSGISGSDGSATLAKDGACPRDADINDDGIIEQDDIALIIDAYGNVSSDSTYNSRHDISCDEFIDVMDLARIGFQYGRR
jgi:hypothetical protein